MKQRRSLTTKPFFFVYSLITVPSLVRFSLFYYHRLADLIYKTSALRFVNYHCWKVDIRRSPPLSHLPGLNEFIVQSSLSSPSFAIYPVIAPARFSFITHFFFKRKKKEGLKTSETPKQQQQEENRTARAATASLEYTLLRRILLFYYFYYYFLILITIAFYRGTLASQHQRCN